MLYSHSSGQTAPSSELVSTGQTGTIPVRSSFHNVRILTTEEIELLNFQTLNDVLQYCINNFSVYQGKDGYSLNYMGTGRKNVKFLLDGLPIFQTSIDNVDLSSISLIDVERIEILNGASGVFNGPNAALATINIITRSRYTRPWHHKLNINTSSKGDLNGSAKGTFNYGRNSISLSHAQYFFSGVGGKDSSRVFQWKPRLRNQTGIYYTYRILNDLKAYFSSNLIYSRVQDRGYPIPNTLRAYDTEQKVSHNIFHAGITGKISKYHTIDFSHSYTNYLLVNKRTIKILSDLSTIENEDRNAFDRLHYDEYYNQFRISKVSDVHKLNYEAALEFSHQRDLERAVLSAVKTNITQLAVLGNISYKADENVDLKGGIRYTNSNKFSTPLIYELGMKYKMSPTATFVAQYSKGYRTPTYNEMFYTFENPELNILGNLNLQSETFNQFNATLKITSDNLLVSTNLYWANSNNGIQLTQVDTTRQLYQFVNNKASKLMGQNVTVVYHSKALNLEFAASNNGINQFPRELGSFYFSQELLGKVWYKLPKEGINIISIVKYGSKRNETRENALGDLEDFRLETGYWLWDIAVRVKLFNRPIFGSIGLKNITNTFDIGGAYLPVDRFSDEEINQKIPISIDYGRRVWFSLVSEI